VNTLQRYLLGQVVAAFCMAVLVFVFVLLLGNVLQEVLTLLVRHEVPPALVLEALGFLLPYVAPFALPMGILTAPLLVLGRFSADQELTAARAGGFSLTGLAAPILAFGLLLSLVSVAINAEWAPRSRVAYKAVLAQVGLQMAGNLIAEQQYIHDFPGLVLYVGKNTRSGLEEILLWKLDARDRAEFRLRAETGRLLIEDGGDRLRLELHDVVAARRGSEGWLPAGYARTLVYELTPPNREGPRRPKLSEMTWRQLRQELDLRRQQGVDITPVRVQLHQRVAFGFACFSFCLVGIPLGARLHRRETNVSVGIALVLVALYFSFLLLAGAWDTRPEWHPHLVVWLPNFLFQTAGAWLLWRADHGP